MHGLQTLMQFGGAVFLVISPIYLIVGDLLTKCLAESFGKTPAEDAFVRGGQIIHAQCQNDCCTHCGRVYTRVRVNMALSRLRNVKLIIYNAACPNFPLAHHRYHNTHAVIIST